MNDATVDMTQEEEDPPPAAIETSLADLATTFGGNFIPNSRSPAPNHTGSHDLVSQTAVTCVFQWSQKKKEAGRIEQGEEGYGRSRADSESIAGSASRQAGGLFFYLHTRVYGRADGTAEGVPNLVIEPLGEPFPTVVVQVLGGAEVKVGIEFVYD